VLQVEAANFTAPEAEPNESSRILLLDKPSNNRITISTNLTRITEMSDHFAKFMSSPAKAGIHFAAVYSQWIPACAGMTTLESERHALL
jgi:hypothetical protein